MDTKKKAEFIRLFNTIKPEKHRHEVWRDFITTSAIALHNATYPDHLLETEYLEIINTYSSDDIQRLCEMLSLVVLLLEPEPMDVLGALYMELALASQNNGQYFTPDCVSRLIASILHGSRLSEKLQQPFVTLQEPACGAGGMILAFAKVVIDEGYNPAEKLWVSAIDINRIAALMAYIQLSLWNIPAEVIVGNTLTLDLRERWLTPAHQLYHWEHRLRWQSMMDNVRELMVMETPDKQGGLNEVLEEPAQTVESRAGSQVAFDFSF